MFLDKIFKKSFDYSILYTTGDWNVRNIVQGLSFETKIDIRRNDEIIATCQIIPTAKSVKEKNNYFLSNVDSIKLEAEMFIRNYIKTYMPFSLEDYIGILNMELLTDDNITRFSLEKVAYKIKAVEIQFDKNKNKKKEVIDDLKKDWTKQEKAWK